MLTRVAFSFAFDRFAAAASTSAGWVAALDHEAFDVAVEKSVFVVALLGEFYEVPDGARGEFGEELEV